GIESDPANRLRTLNQFGTYVQSAGGRLVVQLGRASTSEYDKFTVTGAVTLGGTLEVRFAPGFNPTPGEVYDIMTFPSRTGTFSTVTFGGFPIGNAFAVSYLPTAVRITIASLVDVPDELPRELAFS